MKKNVKDTVNFNKEILFGEIGTLIGTQLFGHYASKIFTSPTKISVFVVLGSIICGSLFWFLMRVYDRKIRKKKSNKALAKEISYFVMASISLAVCIYYPTLFYSTRHFLVHHNVVSYSAIVSQAVAFLLFLVGMNVYRHVLIKWKKIIL